MKSLLLFVFSLFLGSQATACHCSFPEFMKKYVQADFVARVKIAKNFHNKRDSLSYRSDIEITKLFKGKPAKSIWVEGSSDGKKRTSCDIFFREGTELLVYARLDSAGHYTFGPCDNYRVLSRSGDRGQVRELAMLDFLDKNNIRTTDKTHYGADLREQLQSLRGKVAENHFAIYELTFMSDMRVDTVKTLSGFGPELDQALTLILKQARWGVYRSAAGGQRNQVPPESKHLIAFYYYPAESTFANFIGEYDL